MVNEQKKIDRFRQGMTKAFYYALRTGLSLGFGYFTAQSSLLQELSPFSLILLTCSSGMGLIPTGCYLGSTFGYLIRPFDLSLFKYITALTMIYVIYIVFGRSLRVLRGDMAVTSAACCFVSGFLFLLVGQLTLFNILLLIAECVLICCSIYFVSYAVRGFKKNCFLTPRELIAAAVTLILVMISLHNISILRMSAARILGLVIVFLGIHCLKTSHTAVLGSCVGIILSVVAGGGDAIFIAVVVSTMTGCIFSNFSGRFAELTMLVVYYAVLIFFGNFPWNYWLFSEPVAASAIAFIIPKEKLRSFLSSYIIVKSKNNAKSKNNTDKIIEACREECASFCPKAPGCYQKNMNLFAEGLEELSERYLQTEEIGDIEAYFPFCNKPKSLEKIVSRQLILANSEGYDELAQQLDQLSRRMEKKMEASFNLVRFLRDEEESIKKALDKRKIYVKEINFIVDERRMRRCEIEFSSDEELLFEHIFRQVLAPYFPKGFALHLHFCDDIGRLRAIETDRFRISCAAICKTRDGEELCGDKAFGFSIGNGIYYLLLADGMGSGKEAALQSENAIETLRKLLMGGIPVYNAVNILRSASRFRHIEGFTTLDICRIDLNAGNADFYKAGAYDSFCLKNDRLIRIDGGGMPPGLAAHERLKHTSIKLADDSTLIMASDGISLLGKEMELILFECADPDARKYARNIHKRIAESLLDVGDDITVVVGKIGQSGN